MSRLLRLLPLVALALASCASTSGSSQPKLTPIAQMPQEQQAVLLAYAADGEEWSRLRQELKRDPERARWMCRNLALELFRAYDDADLAGIGEVRGPFERARDELIFFGEHAVPVLVELLPARDGVVPVVASDLLARIGAPAVAPVAELLAHPEWRTRRFAAELLGDLPHAGAGEVALEAQLAAAAQEDPEWIVRAQAARSLGARGARHTTPEPAREGLQRVLGDADPAVAREAAAALSALGDPHAVPALLNYLERSERAKDARAQHAARDALIALTGAKGVGSARAWRDWWRDHRGKLLQAPPDPPY